MVAITQKSPKTPIIGYTIVTKEENPIPDNKSARSEDISEQTNVLLTYSFSQFVIVNKRAKAVLKSPSHTTNKTKNPKGLLRLAPKNTIGIS